MKNIMIDIETLGTNPDSCVLQIAATSWDGNEIDVGFLFDVSLSEQVEAGRTIEAKTVCWWLDDKVQSRVRSSVLGRSELVSPQAAVYALNEYIRVTRQNSDDGKVTVWANPPQFDLTIIKSIMKEWGITPSWNHWEERDLRTLRNVCRELKINYENKNEEHHSAIADVRHQVEEVMFLMKELKSRMNLSFHGNTPISESIYITPNTSSQE